MDAFITNMQTLTLVCLYGCALVGLLSLGARLFDYIAGAVRMYKIRKLCEFYAEHPAVERKRSLPVQTDQDVPVFELRPCSDEELVSPLEVSHR